MTRARHRAAPELRTPYLTVDAIIELRGGIVLIERKNPPKGWALPGGYVEYGESVERAVVREAREETGLNIRLIQQFHVYSDPGRDARRHNAAVVFIAKASGTPKGGDDAALARRFSRTEIPWALLAFDHGKILKDYFRYKLHRSRQEMSS